MHLELLQRPKGGHGSSLLEWPQSNNLQTLSAHFAQVQSVSRWALPSLTKLPAIQQPSTYSKLQGLLPQTLLGNILLHVTRSAKAQALAIAHGNIHVNQPCALKHAAALSKASCFGRLCIKLNPTSTNHVVSNLAQAVLQYQTVLLTAHVEVYIHNSGRKHQAQDDASPAGGNFRLPSVSGLHQSEVVCCHA